ncbi:PREDICTED: leukocyte surface antigen CD47 isoform X2 [Hipposideros armiger]|uniref:Leukocyte surface antigen CD47 n=1 Tax=Hipposideros armiger TaxID=186990 RepID=A0A8B7S036_HIPAR|nr:PREDICTED: leukocyte surface antigen CD47 isoform X2 [Hipposideros armiger]
MWPLVVLQLLNLAYCGSAQLLLNVTKFVEYTNCNNTILLPCIVYNIEATALADLFVKWKLGGSYIFTYNGATNESIPFNFTSAKISTRDLLKGNASLEMDRKDAVPGNYTCEVTELSREGETTVELRYHTGLTSHACAGKNRLGGESRDWKSVSWFSPNENILIVIFPMLAILLFWGQFGIVTLKYNSSIMKEKTILLFIAGLVLTVIVIVGAILFIPGEYSTKRASGLGLIVVPTVMLIILQYSIFIITPGIGMSSYSIAILILQILGFVLSVVGLSLCVTECAPVHGPLLISGLGIVALAELLGLVYMKLTAANQRTIQPPRKAVEEPLNE